MNAIKDFIDISKYAGERFDLVQAGGGNSSLKLENGEMLIKASGFLLSEVTENNGYSRVKTEKIANIVKNNAILKETNKRKREALSANLVKEATLDKLNRPSIETLLHSFLYKYSLHTHPIVVNMLVIQKNYQDLLKSIFKDDKIAIIPYRTPGIELALALNDELSKYTEIPKIIFLQNHGLIISSPNKSDIQDLTEYVLQKIEGYLKIDLSHYKQTNKVSTLLNSFDKQVNSTYLSEDSYLNKQLIQNKALFFYTPFCPDSLVYCGLSCCEINSFFDTQSLEKYKEKYFELPKVLIYKNNLFFIAKSIKKAKEMEEVLKFQIMVLEQNIKNAKNFLANEELAYLSNWEAEQYRKK